jgi:hypothetical protein
LPDARKIRRHQTLDSNVAHRWSGFEFFSKLLEIIGWTGHIASMVKGKKRAGLIVLLFLISLAISYCMN